MVTTAARFSNGQPGGCGDFVIIASVSPTSYSPTVSVPSNFVLPEGETMTWDWGDGTVETGLTGAPSAHTYTVAQSTYPTFKIRIAGKIQAIATNGASFLSVTPETVRVFKNGWAGFVQIGSTNPDITGSWVKFPVTDIPDTVHTIGNRAYYGCQIHNIAFPSGVRTLGREICSGSSWLNTCTMPEGLLAIPDKAFFNSSALTTVTIPASVVSIGRDILGETNALTTIVVATGNPVFGTVGNNKGLIDNVHHILHRTINGCGVTSVPDGVVALGDDAFFARTDMTSAFECPGRVTSIGNRSFKSSRITAFNCFEDGLQTIGTDAFSACVNLRTVRLPASVKSVASGDVSSLMKSSTNVAVTVLSPTVLQTVDASTSGINAASRLYVRPELVESYKLIEPWKTITSQVLAFAEGILAVNVEVPSDDLTVSFAPAFSGSNGLITVVMDWGDGTVENVYGNPAGRTHTYARAGTYRVTVTGPFDSFQISYNYHCLARTSTRYASIVSGIVTTGSTLTSLTERMFNGASALRGTVVVRYPVTSIENSCFSNCNGVTTFDIAESVTDLGYGAFDITSGTEPEARTFIMRPTVPPTFAGRTSGQYPPGFKSYDTIYVPDDSWSAYRNSVRWLGIPATMKRMSELPA